MKVTLHLRDERRSASGTRPSILANTSSGIEVATSGGIIM
jgi:hypothetical protein